MLSREERILSEILVSRGLVSQGLVEACATERQTQRSSRSLAEILVDQNAVAEPEVRKAAEEARSLDEALVPEMPVGKRLGEFRLIREIGRGGMGIVYEAEQESLGRRVALKILPAGAALDERLAIRFLREARAAGRLRHPGIVPVYTSGRAEGVLYFAMELVEGRTLADEIAAGPIAPGRSARLASEIARALDYAHTEGLVHRDVKPENVLIAADDRARITDFGLVLEAASGSFTLSRYVLGTPAFMAPEQARGETVDPRSDVYAAGSVLYAMLSGKPPYAGDVPSLVLARVLTESPAPLLSLRPELPPPLVAACERAMSREPSARYPTAAELASDLERFLQTGTTSGDRLAPRLVPEVERRTIARRARLALLVVFAVILAALVTGFLRNRRTEPAWVPGPDASRAVFEQVLTSPGRKVTPSVSPDGRWLAYASEVDGDWDLYLLDLRGGSPVNLTPDNPHDDRFPAFSPDGSRLAFVSARQVKGIHLMDLASRRVSELLERTAAGLSWSSDGGEIFFMDRGDDVPGISSFSAKAWAVEIATGRQRTLTGINASQPSSSRATGRVGFIAQGGGRTDVWTLPESGGPAERLTDDGALEWSPVWSADGSHVYFGSDRDGSSGLWGVSVDPASGRPLGDPIRVSPVVFGAAFFLATGGDRMILIPVEERGRLHRLSLAPTPGDSSPRASALPKRFMAADYPQVSPDGRRLVFMAFTSQEDLAIGTVDGSESHLITEDAYRDRDPRWSSDGSTIVFQSDRGGSMETWTVRPDGTGLTRASGPTADAERVQLDPRHVLYTENREIRMLDARAGVSRTLFSFAPAGVSSHCGVTPDRSAVYVSVTGSAEEVWDVRIKD